MKHNRPIFKVKKHSTILCILLFLFNYSLIYSQSKIISGTVSSGSEELIGANVMEKGTGNGTITDLNGKFTLQLNKGDEVEVSYLGFETVTIKVGNQTILNVNLKEDASLLNEVVAIGYGVQQKKLLSGATVQVKGDNITKLSNVNALGALQSQTPGVNIIKSSGKPGAGFKVTIRGIGTIGSSDPLYIIDGVPNGDIGMLNPGDIESIDVLKDAASAAIYGARASNGVILVTTKQGKKGKTTTQYDGYFGWQNVAKQTKTLDANQYLSVLDKAGYDREYFDANVPAEILENIDNGTFNGTNWLDEMTLKNAPIQSHSVNITSGSDVSTYSLGFSYTSQNPIIGLKDPDVPSKYERYTVRMNSNHDLIKVNDMSLLNFGQTFTMGYKNSSGLGMGTGSIYWNDIRNALAGNPLLPLSDNNGDYHLPLSGLDYSSSNPIADMDYLRSRVESKNYTARGSFYLTLQPIKDLKIKTNFGYAYNGYSSREYIPKYFLNTVNFSDLDKVSQGTGNGLQWSWDNTINYNFTLLANHKFNALLGNSFEKWGLGSGINGINKGSQFNSFEYAYLSNVNTIDNVILNGSPWSEGGIASFFGRLNYDYLGKYMASFVMRSDGSSNFAKGHRWGYFPSVSAGWNIAEESFFDNFRNFTDQLKLRASWGENGNCNIPNFRYLSSIAFGNTGNAAGYYYGTDQSSPTFGAYPDLISNPDLKWETSRQIDIGIDSRFLNNRLGFTIDLYEKKTMDWLVQPAGLAIWGTGSPYVNGGDVMNSGVEIALDWNDKIGEDFTYSVQGNMAYNKNEVLSINNADGFINGASNILSTNTSYLYRAEVGYPIGYFRGYKTDGIFQNQEEIDAYLDKDGSAIMSSAKPGDVKFLDLDESGSIDEGDKTMIGDPHPDITYGINLSFGYKSFDLSITGYGVAGNQIAKSYRNWTNKPFDNYTPEILGAWDGEGTSNTIPAIGGSTINRSYISDLYIENGDYFRITNITLGYDLKKSMKSLPISQMRIYGTIQNPFTFTKYSGMDPEVGYNGGDSWASGIDLGYYPSAQTIMIGCNIKF